MPLAGTRRLSRLLVAGGLFLSACAVAGTTPSQPVTTTTGHDFAASGDLVVIGDWGSGTPSQEAVAGSMARYTSERDIAAILTTGDNLYSDNAGSLMAPLEWATERDIPIVVSWGNHDVDTHTRIALINEWFGDPPRWATHEWGPVDIVILDSTQVGSDEQTHYLIDALATNDDPTIVVFHHPPYSCGSHGDTAEVLDEWVPRFDEDVMLVLTGHEHNYQRFETGGVTYVVTGGGGAGLTELAECPTDHPPRVAGEAIHHFVVLELTRGLTVTAIDAGGRVVDEFTLALD